jgi:hypothetical protein
MSAESYPTVPIKWCGEPHPHGPHRYGSGLMAWYTDCPGSACNCSTPVVVAAAAFTAGVPVVGGEDKQQ